MKVKIIYRLSIFMSILIFSNSSYGQSYSQSVENLFNGRLPHARKEAMGKTGVASNGFLYANLSNPASIGEIDGIYLNHSNDPIRSLLFQDKNDWYSEYYGLAVGYNEFSFAVEYYQKRWYKLDRYSPSGEYEGTFEDKASLFSFVGSYEVLTNLFLGSAIRYSISEFVDKLESYSVDIGVINKIFLHDNSDINYSINIGASFSNILNAYHIKYSYGHKDAPPNNLRFGVSNNINFKNNIFINNLVLDAEINRIVHSRPQLEFGFYNGVEINTFNYLLLRGGYFYESYQNETYYSEFTYGFGVKLPIYELFKTNSIPIEIELDFTQLYEPILNNANYFYGTPSRGDLGDFISYSIILKWLFKK